MPAGNRYEQLGIPSPTFHKRELWGLKRQCHDFFRFFSHSNPPRLRWPRKFSFSDFRKKFYFVFFKTWNENLSKSFADLQNTKSNFGRIFLLFLRNMANFITDMALAPLLELRTKYRCHNAHVAVAWRHSWEHCCQIAENSAILLKSSGKTEKICFCRGNW